MTSEVHGMLFCKQETENGEFLKGKIKLKKEKKKR